MDEDLLRQLLAVFPRRPLDSPASPGAEDCLIVRGYLIPWDGLPAAPHEAKAAA